MKNLFKSLWDYHPWQKLALLAVLGLAVHLIVPQITSLEQSWNTLKSLISWGVVLAVIAQVLSYLGSGYLLQTILDLTHRQIKLWRSTLIVLGASSVGMVAGGMLGSSVAIYRWSNQGEEHPEKAMLASILPAVLNDLILMFIAIFGLAHLILLHDLSKAQLIGFITIASILALVIGLASLALHYRAETTAVIGWFAGHLARLRRKSFDPAGLQDSIRSFFLAWDALRTEGWRDAALGAILNVLFDMLTLFFLFIAAGHGVSSGVLLAGYGLPLLLGKVAFVVPGGVGVVEASMTALYNMLGVPDAVTVVVVLSYRMISFWLPSLSGFPIAAYLRRSKSPAHNQYRQKAVH